MDETKEIRVVFDAPPGRDMPTLVDVEDDSGRCIDAGRWRKRPDGYWELVFRGNLAAQEQPDVEAFVARFYFHQQC